MSVMPATNSLLEDLEAGLGEAERRKRAVLVSATAEVEPMDAAAAVCAARLASDHWFCWEQADRGFALAALGVADQLVSRGDARFADLADGAASLARDRIDSGAEGAPAGVGPAWCGGFSFAADGGGTGPWSSFPPASLTLPELSLCTSGGRTWLTANLVAGPGRVPAGRLQALRSRILGLRDAELPMLDPVRTGRVTVRGASPPGDFERSVAAATARIDAGALTKVVLAREVVVTAPSAHDPAAIFGALRELFPTCFSFCCGTPEAAFLGASPELLVRRSGASASTVALAGSTRRSSDPAVDDHLGEQLLRSDKDRREQEIVAKRIVRTLRPHAVWVEREQEPTVVKVANIQHLATPIVAQLADSHSAVELAGLLHPTPAVGGEPWPLAGETIAELEKMDRGWYAGPVGWMDATEDGEFCVALRSGVLRDRAAHLFAGVGVVSGSDPAAELAETEIKLGALLPLLAE